MLQKNTGFSLIELMITMVIVGIMATMAVPAMNSFFSTNKLYGLTEKIQTDMEWGRTQAILTSKNITMSINSGETWCYGFDDSPATACDCTNAPANCTVGTIQKTNSINNYSNTTVATDLPDASMTFTSRGFLDTFNNNTITLSDGGATNTTINITPLGKGNACSNSLVQYTTC